MRRPATPGEVARWRKLLSPLPPDRQVAVIRMIAAEIAICPVCEDSIRRCDPRRLDGGRLLHLRCTSDAGDGAPPAGGSGG
jgi:hypothetical protein